MGCDLKEAFDAPKDKHFAKTCAESADLPLSKPFLDWCRDYLVDPLHIRAAMSMGQSLECTLKNCPVGKINSLPMQVNGYDNAMAENFFSILKTECIYPAKPKDFLQAEILVDDFIYFYNYERI